jgi:hypothetical protein
VWFGRNSSRLHGAKIQKAAIFRLEDDKDCIRGAGQENSYSDGNNIINRGEREYLEEENYGTGIAGKI